jgi:hypothetical protein
MDTTTQPTEATPLELALSTSGLEADGQLVIREALSPFYQQAADWQAKVALVTEPTVARASRLLLKKIRVEAGHKKDELKAALLVKTRAIDAAFKAIEATIAPMEATLDAIEKAAERAEVARIAKLKTERDAQLLALGMSPTFFQTGQMPEDAFQGLLGQARAAHESRQAQAAAAEAKRIADAEAAKVAAAAKAKADEEERARVAAEHERIRKQAEADRQARIEADRLAEQERAKAKAERDAIEAKAKKDRDAAAAKLKTEREAREKLEREAAAAKKAKAEADAKAKADADRLAAAPDAEKLRAYLAAVEAIPLPAIAAPKGVAGLNDYIKSARNQLRNAIQVAIASLES